LIRLADEILPDEVEGPFELPIGVQVTALQILEKDQARAVIHHALKSRFAVVQSMFNQLAHGDIQQRRPPTGDASGLFMNRETLEIDAREGTGVFPDMHFTALSRACLQNLLTMALEDVLIIPCNETCELLSEQLLPADAEQRCCTQTGLHNRAAPIQREVADWRKIVEFGVAVTSRFQL
jgi:hypothetical protein